MVCQAAERQLCIGALLGFLEEGPLSNSSVGDPPYWLCFGSEPHLPQLPLALWDVWC